MFEIDANEPRCSTTGEERGGRSEAGREGKGMSCRRSKSKKAVVLTGMDRSARAVTEGRAGRIAENGIAHQEIDSLTRLALRSVVGSLKCSDFVFSALVPPFPLSPTISAFFQDPHQELDPAELKLSPYLPKTSNNSPAEELPRIQMPDHVGDGPLNAPWNWSDRGFRSTVPQGPTSRGRSER